MPPRRRQHDDDGSCCFRGKLNSTHHQTARAGCGSAVDVHEMGVKEGVMRPSDNRPSALALSRLAVKLHPIPPHLRHRYREFDALDLDLRDAYPDRREALPRLPPKVREQPSSSCGHHHNEAPCAAGAKGVVRSHLVQGAFDAYFVRVVPLISIQCTSTSRLIRFDVSSRGCSMMFNDVR